MRRRVSPSSFLWPSSERQHRLLELRLEVRRVARRRDEAVRQNTVGAHLVERGGDRLLRHARGQHAAKVAQERQRAEFLLGDQAFERFLLRRAAGELDLPGVGRGQRAVDELLPDLRLIRVRGLGVRDEEHVAQAHRAVAVVLRQLIGVELREGFGEALLHLRRHRTLLALLLQADDVGPVDGEELRHLVRTLDHAFERLRPPAGGAFRSPPSRARGEAARGAASSFRARRSRFAPPSPGSTFGHERLDAVGDRFAVLVELILPEHAVHHRTAQLLLRAERRAPARLRACAPS